MWHRSKITMLDTLLIFCWRTNKIEFLHTCWCSFKKRNNFYLPPFVRFKVHSFVRPFINHRNILTKENEQWHQILHSGNHQSSNRTRRRVASIQDSMLSLSKLLKWKSKQSVDMDLVTKQQSLELLRGKKLRPSLFMAHQTLGSKAWPALSTF